MSTSGWIGVDLDGTLAHYEGWVGVHHVGAPIPLMVDRVKAWLAEGTTVKIFTARVYDHLNDESLQEQIRRPIIDWCKEHIGQELEITCVKDFGMIELWDDRAVSVKINTGLVIGGTGKYPDGKLGPDDEGELKIMATVTEGVLRFDFNKEVAMLGFDPSSARQVAERLILFAETGL